MSLVSLRFPAFAGYRRSFLGAQGMAEMGRREVRVRGAAANAGSHPPTLNLMSVLPRAAERRRLAESLFLGADKTLFPVSTNTGTGERVSSDHFTSNVGSLE